MNSDILIYEALQKFAAAVTEKMTQITSGEPEDQLRAPFESLISAAASVFGWEVICTGEVRLPGHLGKPELRHTPEQTSHWIRGTQGTRNRSR